MQTVLGGGISGALVNVDSVGALVGAVGAAMKDARMHACMVYGCMPVCLPAWHACTSALPACFRT